MIKFQLGDIVIRTEMPNELLQSRPKHEACWLPHCRRQYASCAVRGTGAAVTSLVSLCAQYIESAQSSLVYMLELFASIECSVLPLGDSKHDWLSR